MDAPKTYLLVIGHRVALAWVLQQGRMAFPAGRHRIAGALRVGDRALIYTTRSCYGNPRRDRGRVIAEAVVASATDALEEPPIFGDRTFPVGCALAIESLAPWGSGVELGPLAPEMHVFKVAARWPVYLRRPLLALDDHDAGLVRGQLAPFVGPVNVNLDGYLKRAAIRDRRASPQLVRASGN